MANTYVKAAFAITMTRAEASVIQDAETACSIIDDAGEAEDLTAAYDQLGFAFRTAFPARENNPFGAFFEIFDDPVYPTLDCEIEYGLPDAMGMCEVTFRGDQFGVEQVAALIFTGCKSALPCGFEYAYDCDRLRIGEFGGGAVVITEHGPTFHATSGFIDRALTTTAAEPDDGTYGFVLAAPDTDHGLSFWNDNGYGRLAAARIFTETEAATFVPSIAGGPTEWLTMPAPVA